MAGFFQGEQSMLIGGQLVARGADLIKQLCPLQSVESHGQCRRLADRETDHASGDRWRYHDLTAFLADQAGRYHRVFRPDVLAGMTGGRGCKMREVSLRQGCRFMPAPTVRSFHENLAGTVDDDFGQGVVR